jgi:hypothetical protein
MPGYSGTPLPKKLGIKDGFRCVLLDATPDVRGQLRETLLRCELLKEISDAIDFAMIFAKSKTALKKKFIAAEKSLAPAGMIWVSWPKKSSGVTSDLDESIVREVGLAAGLVDVKVCAVTDVWSGLKFVRRVKDREK